MRIPSPLTIARLVIPLLLLLNKSWKTKGTQAASHHPGIPVEQDQYEMKGYVYVAFCSFAQDISG